MKLRDGNGIELQIFASSSFGDLELCCVMRIMMQWNSAVALTKAMRSDGKVRCRLVYVTNCEGKAMCY